MQDLIHSLLRIQFTDGRQQERRNHGRESAASHPSHVSQRRHIWRVEAWPQRFGCRNAQYEYHSYQNEVKCHLLMISVLCFSDAASAKKASAGQPPNRKPTDDTDVEHVTAHDELWIVVKYKNIDSVLTTLSFTINQKRASIQAGTFDTSEPLAQMYSWRCMYPVCECQCKWESKDTAKQLRSIMTLWQSKLHCDEIKLEDICKMSKRWNMNPSQFCERNSDRSGSQINPIQWQQAPTVQYKHTILIIRD